MFSLTSSHQYFLYATATDMRKSFDSLCGIVRGKLERNPINGEVYVFLNRRRTQVKLLHWENGGFVMYYKRLESGNFELPALNNGSLSWPQLVMMIEGVSLKNITFRKRYGLKKNA
jgi:transposase